LKISNRNINEDTPISFRSPYLQSHANNMRNVPAPQYRMRLTAYTWRTTMPQAEQPNSPSAIAQ
ncbi:hypothetical protein T07_4164, partial [Trichinella nelsoni]